MFAAVVHEAAVDAGCQVTVVEQRTQGRDHPVLLGVPETQYLTCLILRKAGVNGPCAASACRQAADVACLCVKRMTVDAGEPSSCRGWRPAPICRVKSPPQGILFPHRLRTPRFGGPSDDLRSVSRPAAGCTRVDCCGGCSGPRSDRRPRPDVHQGRRADLPGEVRGVPPARFDRADVARHLRGSAAVGALDQERASPRGRCRRGTSTRPSASSTSRTIAR